MYETLKKALTEIAQTAHDEECATQMATSRGHPGPDTPCTCHVGVAESALAALEKSQEAPKDSVEAPFIMVSPPDPRAIDAVLVNRYRTLAAKAALEKKWSPTLLPTPETAEQRDEAAVALADDICQRADAIMPADASLLKLLDNLVHSASYMLGNPMSGLGANSTVRIALESLKEAELLLAEELRK